MTGCQHLQRNTNTCIWQALKQHIFVYDHSSLSVFQIFYFKNFTRYTRDLSRNHSSQDSLTMSMCTIILELHNENRLGLKKLTIWLSFTLATRLGGCWNRYCRNCRSTSRRFRGSGCLLYPTIHRNCKPLCCCDIPLIALFCLLFRQSTEKYLNKVIIYYKLPWGPDYQSVRFLGRSHKWLCGTPPKNNQEVLDVIYQEDYVSSSVTLVAIWCWNLN